MVGKAFAEGPTSKNPACLRARKLAAMQVAIQLGALTSSATHLNFFDGILGGALHLFFPERRAGSLGAEGPGGFGGLATFFLGGGIA